MASDEKKKALDAAIAKLEKDFGKGTCCFYDEEEYAELLRRYGSLKHLQTVGQVR